MSTSVIASVCAYVDRQGQPEPDSYIGLLYESGPDIPKLLSERISNAIKSTQPIQVHLMHDGTTAAASFAGMGNTAVVVLGTALGLGVPPASKGSIRGRISDFSPFIL